MASTLRSIAVVCGLALLAGCATSGEIDNPAERRFTWFSFISGEDIARDCAATGRERYRLTQIADREIQVRVYDIDAGLAPDTQLRSRVLAGAANDWFPWPILTDPSRPFRPHEAVAPLPPEKLTAVRDALVAAGWSTRPPPVGRLIASHSYSWLAAGCRDGQFHFQVWEYPDADYLSLGFPAILTETDGNPIRPRPEPTDGERRTFNAFMGRTGGNMPTDGRELYNMKIGPNGVTISN
jgi:hypothetical protein